MNSQSASNPYLLIIPPFITDITDRRLRDRQVAIVQRAERKLQRCLSLTEIEVDMDMRWHSRFMPREQKRFIDSDFCTNYY
jgi:hypothetical protein